MALSATFTANFASFYAAVDKADAVLKDFGTGADKVGGRLDTLANQFSGRKIVQEATIMAKAVEDIGGASFLTEKELARLGATANEAVAKMKALGMDVPQNLQEIASSAEKASTKTSFLNDTFTQMAAALSVSSLINKAVSGLIGIGKAAIDNAGKLVDMNVQTGVSIEGLQRMAFVAEHTSTTVEAFADVIFKMGTNVEKGSKETVQAVEKLGVSFEEFRALSPEEQFNTLVKNVDKLGPAGVRNADLIAIGGKAVGATISGMVDGYQRLASQATVTGAAQIKAIDAASEKWDEFAAKMGTGITRTAGNVLLLTEAMSNNKITWSQWFEVVSMKAGPAQDAAIAKLALTGRTIGDLTEDQKRYIKTQTELGTSQEYLLRMVGASQEAVEAYQASLKTTTVVHHKTKEQLDAEAKAQAEAAAAAKKHREALDNLTGGNEKVAKTTYDIIAALLKQGQAQGDIVEGLGVKAIIVTQVAAAEKAAAEAAKVAADNEKRWTDQRVAGLLAVQKIMADAEKRAQDSPITKATLTNLGIESKARRAAADEQAKLSLGTYDFEKYQIQQWGVDQKKAVDKSAANWESAYAAIDQTVHDKLIAIVSHQQAVVRVTSDWSEQVSILADEFTKLGQAAGGSLGSILSGTGQMVVMFEAATAASKQIGVNGQALGGKFGPISTMFNDNATSAQKWGAAVQAGSAIASGAMEVWSATSDAAGKSANTLHGAMAGAKAGSAFGPWGTAIGAAAGALTGFIRSLNDGRQAVEAFANTQGGFDALHTKLLALGAEGEQMWIKLTQQTGKGDLGAAREEIEKITAALGASEAALKLQADGYDLAIQTAQKYGFTIEELGPAMQRQELDKQAQQLYKDWQVLNSAGLDTVLITEKMSRSVSEYVQHASKMGTEVPEAMRPMLEAMAKSGTLLDENGNAISNLEDSGITFAMSMSDGFKKLIDQVEKLTDAISRSLGLAIKNVPPVNVKGKVTWDVDPVPTGGGSQPVESYQGGTDGFRNFGTGTPVMLHGWEAVVPREESSSSGAFATVSGAPVGAAAAAALAPSIVINAQGAFFDTPGDLQRLADRVNDALTAKFGLRNAMRAG